MNSRLLAFGFLEYVVFLLSTTCHEAAHALVAKWGGDDTAFEGGQVTLNPLPHIKREFFGMVLLPLIGIFSGNGLFGYASAPFNPEWSIRYPKRAGWMSLAGPAANFALALIAGILMRLGLVAGVFVPGAISFTQIVSAPEEGYAVGAATVLSVLFSLNVILGTFNLIPLPPLDGFGALSLFTDSDGALRLLQWRGKMRLWGLAIIILVGSYIYEPVLVKSVRLVYAFYHFR